MDIDYTHIWKDGPIRDQGKVGNCHSFTTVALLEARYFKENYLYRAFSPYDLFINHMLETEKMFKKQRFLTHPLQEFVIYGKTKSLDGGNEFSNLKLVKKYGLALDEQQPYPAPGTEAMDELVESVRKNSYIWRHAYHEQDIVPYNANVFKCEKVRKNIASLYKQNALNGFYENDTREEFIEERKEVKKFVKGLKLKKTSYLGHWRGHKKERLVSYLRCNPLVLTISNYHKLIPKDRDQRGKSSGVEVKDDLFNPPLHSVVLVGFIEGTNDFLIKNSWGHQVERYDADKFSERVEEAAYLRRGFEKTSNCTYAENPIRYQ